MSWCEDRFQRQSQVIPQARLTELRATVIGVGAIGRQLAIQLASIGVRNLQLIDFDLVEPTNVTTQGYRHNEVGQSKVAVCKEAILEIDPLITVHTVCDRFRRRQSIGSIAFCCVDSIQTRSMIWKSVQGMVEFWCDGRMLAEVMRVLVAVDDASSQHYETTLFDSSEAQQGSCTSQATIYTASIAAGMMVHQFSRWLRDLPTDADSTVNLLSTEWVVSDLPAKQALK